MGASKAVKEQAKEEPDVDQVVKEERKGSNEMVEMRESGKSAEADDEAED